MSLSRKDLDELRPMLDRTVQKFLGFTEPTLVTAALNCVDKGYEKRKTIDKLSAILDESQAIKFSEKLYDTVNDFKSSSRHSRSRKRKDDRYEDVSDSKKSRKTEEVHTMPVGTGHTVSQVATVPIPEPGQPSPGQLTADKIKEMMANAQRTIQERKAQLGHLVPSVPVAPVPSSQGAGVSSAAFMNDAMEKAKRAAELQARIQASLARTGMGGVNVPFIPGMPAAPAAAKATQQTKPTPLILDEMGRTIDAKTGEAVQLTQHMPTLKANIRAKKREQFKAVHDKPPEEISESKFFDGRLGPKINQRVRRGFKFHERGKFEQLAQRLRTKAQLEKLQNEIASAAKKTGIASAAKLATIQPKNQLGSESIPEVEWWDAVILKNESYAGVKKPISEHVEGITLLVEHPAQMRPPAEPTKPVKISVMLTAKERKKLRRQTRAEAQKELTEKIRLGLMPPPEPKVRMANLMRVLGTEAVQDPTKVEAHVRAQMAKRQKAHEEANADRKLTKEQRRDKKIRKIKDDTSLGFHVSVYRVRDLSNPAIKFKVETNANQLFMTGIVVLHKDCNIVVVEGGPKQQRKYRRLMMHRIKWSEDTGKKSNQTDDTERVVNSCALVWEGEVKSRAFTEMKFKACPTETFAREQFRKLGVEQYWDLAYSGAILEAAGEDM